MSYSQIKNGKIAEKRDELPVIWKAADGSTISCFNCCPPAFHRSHGWLPDVYADVGENQRHGQPVIEPERVFYPAENIPAEEIVVRNIEEAIITREAKVYSPLEYTDGRVFVNDKEEIANLDDALYKAEQEGLPDTEQRPWVLADDTLTIITLADIKGLKLARINRKEQIYNTHAEWLQGDKLTPYE